MSTSYCDAIAQAFDFILEKYNNSKKGVKSSFSVQKENKKLENQSGNSEEFTGEVYSKEEDMLDFAIDVKENSRLSCQIKLDISLDGITIHTPEKQF